MSLHTHHDDLDGGQSVTATFTQSATQTGAGIDTDTPSDQSLGQHRRQLAPLTLAISEHRQWNRCLTANQAALQQQVKTLLGRVSELEDQLETERGRREAVEDLFSRQVLSNGGDH